MTTVATSDIPLEHWPAKAKLEFLLTIMEGIRARSLGHDGSRPAKLDITDDGVAVIDQIRVAERRASLAALLAGHGSVRTQHQITDVTLHRDDEDRQLRLDREREGAVMTSSVARRLPARRVGVGALVAVLVAVLVLVAPAAALAQVSFTPPADVTVGDEPVSVAVGDFNGDGDPDLAVANQSSNDVSVLLGATGGTFSASTSFAAGDDPSSVAVGDFNGDFDPDLAVGNAVSASPCC